MAYIQVTFNTSNPGQDQVLPCLQTIKLKISFYYAIHYHHLGTMHLKSKCFHFTSGAFEHYKLLQAHGITKHPLLTFQTYTYSKKKKKEITKAIVE